MYIMLVCVVAFGSCTGAGSWRFWGKMFCQDVNMNGYSQPQHHPNLRRYQCGG